MTVSFVAREIFKFFYEKAYHEPTSTSVCWSDRARNCLDEFEARIEKKYGDRVGPTYIYNYVLFHYSRYYDKIKANAFKTPTGRITVPMVFGAKPHQMFEDRNVAMDFMLAKSPMIIIEKASKEELKFKRGIDFAERPAVVKQSATRGRKDPIKAIAASGEKPLDTCQDMTDLYDSADGACVICPDQVACKALLKKVLPELYKQKGYE